MTRLCAQTCNYAPLESAEESAAAGDKFFWFFPPAPKTSDTFVRTNVSLRLRRSGPHWRNRLQCRSLPDLAINKEDPMSMYSDLSIRQRLWLLGAVLGAVAIVAVGVLRRQPPPPVDPSEFTIQMSLKQVAPRLNVTGKNLARELGLPLDVAKGKPVEALGVTQDQLDHAVEHLLGHRESVLKYYLLSLIHI